MTLVHAGNSTYYTVWYDDALTGTGGVPDGMALAQGVLAGGDADLTAISALYSGLMPPVASLPIRVDVVPSTPMSGVGASHPTCADTHITINVTNSYTPHSCLNASTAEVVEVFEAVQGQGVDCGLSYGEALSRVGPTILRPGDGWLFSNGNEWLNTNPRIDYVSMNSTQVDFPAIGCASLFLNYLAHELNFTWQQILAAGRPTLAQTAQVLGLPNAFADFAALMARHFPPGTPTYLHDDNPFPLPDPWLYLRHNLTDDGTRHDGSLASSPDIIAKNAPVPNPQPTYSTPASIASDTESDPAILDGQANTIYVRVWNRGTVDATNATATVYWSPPATLVTPNLWHLLGTHSFATVPHTNLVQVSDPGIPWAAGNIPGPGHYCFVATIGSVDDPAPTPTTFATFDDFFRYIYAHNNITWRNFDVVPLPPPPRFRLWPWPRRHPIPLPFLLTGAWDRSREFELELVTNASPKAQIALHAPHWIAPDWAPHVAVTEYADRATFPDQPRRIKALLRNDDARPFAKLELPSDTPIPAHLTVRLPRGRLRQPVTVDIRQLYQGREVGRITWLLTPG